jgi:tetratricopeptide (TPR) repeat protein
MRRLYVGCFLLLAGIGVSVSCARRHDPLRAALQTGDWAAVLKESGHPEAVAGFLRGHTLLAANRNNEASCAFFTAGQQNLDAYSDWTRDLASRYAGSAVAHYLRGDALARRGLWRDAIASFDRSVALDPGFAAAFVGRAAARASTGDWSQALNDLYAAVAAAPQLAEAQSSLGWVLLQGKQPAETAIRYFDRALATSPGYLLAAAGKGFAEMAAGKADEGAQHVVEQMKKDKCVAPLLAADSLLAAAWVSQDDESNPSAVPGNIVIRSASEVKDAVAGIERGDMGWIKRGERMLAQDPSLKGEFTGAYQKLHDTNLARFDQVHRDVPGYADFVKPSGPAQSLLDTGKSAVSVGAPLVAAGVTAATKNAFAGAGVAAVLAGSKDQLEAQKARTSLDYTGWKGVKGIMDKIEPPSNAMSPAPRVGPFPGYPVPSPTPGGATTNLNAAYRDSGTWTLKPVFGLVYPMM